MRSAPRELEPATASPSMCKSCIPGMGALVDSIPGMQDLHIEGEAVFREWVRLSIPLMLGVSLVTADDWILHYFASGAVGDITRLNYAKRLFAVPIAVLGQATSQASLPFFARLFGEKKLTEFADTVNASIYRIV